MSRLKYALLVELLFFFFIPTATLGNPWCQDEHSCKDRRGNVLSKHTMCIYKEKGPPQCQQRRRGLTEDEKTVVLDMHNRIRARVARKETSQLPAANMMRMGWDNEAEEIAQRWADQCLTVGHDKCHPSWKGIDMGQNYAGSSGSGSGLRFRPPERSVILAQMVDGWIAEIGKVKETHVYSYPNGGPKIGHYTQMVWATTTRVGCGLVHLDTPNKWDYKLICNYMGPGNIIGLPVYAVGVHGSKCPEGSVSSKDYPGLCEYPSNSKGQELKPVNTLPAPTAEPPSDTPSGQSQNLEPDAASTSSSIFSLENLPLIGRFFRKKPIEPPAKPPTAPPKAQPIPPLKFPSHQPKPHPETSQLLKPQVETPQSPYQPGKPPTLPPKPQPIPLNVPVHQTNPHTETSQLLKPQVETPQSPKPVLEPPNSPKPQSQSERQQYRPPTVSAPALGGSSEEVIPPSSKKPSSETEVPVSYHSSSDDPATRFFEEANRRRAEFFKRVEDLGGPSFSPYNMHFPDFEPPFSHMDHSPLMHPFEFPPHPMFEPPQFDGNSFATKGVFESPPDPNSYGRLEFYKSRSITASP